MKKYTKISLLLLLCLAPLSLNGESNPFRTPYGVGLAEETAARCTSPMEEEFTCYDAYQRALSFYGKGELMEAGRMAEGILRKAPHPDVFFLMGEITYDMGFYFSAMLSYEMAAASGYWREDYAWYNAACCRSLDYDYIYGSGIDLAYEGPTDYIINALQAGYPHTDYALNDRDLDNLRKAVPSLNDLIESYRKLPSEFRFLTGFYFSSPYLGEGFDFPENQPEENYYDLHRYFLFPDGRLKLYYSRINLENGSNVIARTGRWESEWSDQDGINLKLIYERELYSDGTDAEMTPHRESLFENIERSWYNKLVPLHGYEKREIIQNWDMGPLYRWDRDPVSFLSGRKNP